MLSQQLIDEAARIFDLTDLRPLARGGQKYVAEAQNAAGDVVVKLVALEPVGRDQALERARREVGLLASIDHPNVVRVLSDLKELGDSPPNGVAWLEERLEGEDLRRKLSVPWDGSDVVRLGLHLARGLGAMHDRQAVHRDLSPGNVRCVPDGSFVVMDPGFARHLERTTLTGLWDPGTAGYMTPEHVSPSVRPVPASDVFGVGILMYEAATGTQPFRPGADLDDYQRRVRESQAPSVSALRDGLHADVAQIIDRCLHRQSARRFIDGHELAQALEAI